MKKTKKILVISNMYPGKRSQTYGIFVKNQVEALRDMGWHVDVAAVRDPRRGKVAVLTKYFTWFLRIAVLFLIKGKSYGVVHAHYIFPSGFFGRMFKKAFKTKLIITSHGGDIDQMAKKGLFYQKQTEKILHAANHIIAVGEQLKRDIHQEYHIDKGRITVLNMGVNRNVFKPKQKKSARRTLSLLDKDSILLFVGNRIRAKGLVELLEAYHQLKMKDNDVTLHIIGSVTDHNFQEELEQMIEDKKIKDVTFHPPKEQEEIATWMAAADVFVLPSHIEGFGLVALEAMAVHTPVVGARVGGLQYLLDNQAGVLVEPDNSQALQEGIEIALYDKDKRNELMQQGEMKASAYSQEKLINELVHLYRKK